MLAKLLIVISMVMAMSKFSGVVPSNAFESAVVTNENRALLNLVDSAIVSYFCNNSGNLPEKLDDIEDLGVDKGVLASAFEYKKVAGQPKFSLKILNTNEYSANSNRTMVATALDFSKDENGSNVTVAAEPTMWLSVSAERISEGGGGGGGGFFEKFFSWGNSKSDVLVHDLVLNVKYDDDTVSNNYQWAADSSGDEGLVFVASDYSRGGEGKSVLDTANEAVYGDERLNTFAAACGVELGNLVDSRNRSIAQIVADLVASSGGARGR